MESLSATTPRRGFIKSIAAVAAALAAGRVSTAEAEVASRDRHLLSPLTDAWVARIHGKHRQVFDAVSANDGFAALFALNFIDGYKQTHNSPDSDITAVVSYRHFAMPLVVNDAIWSKYKVGEVINVTDPKTKAPATRNIFHDAIQMHPGLTYEALVAKPGVIMTACNLALTVLSGITAPKAGVTPEVAKQEWIAGLLPGVYLVPSGVYAISRAQEVGCTYCSAG